MEVFRNGKKKKFRLEDGTEVTSDIGIYKTYASSRNKERYLRLRQNEYVTLSLDDERVCEAADNTNVEDDVERRQYVLLLR